MTIAIELRDPRDDDYAIFFEHRRDHIAARMAAFGTQDPTEAAFTLRIKSGIAAGTTNLRTILEDQKVIGFVATFLNEGKTEVTYAIARSQWGRGIATIALTKLIETVSIRPIYASAAKDNVASIRVLQKCGFVITRSGRSFATARGEEIDETFLELRS